LGFEIKGAKVLFFLLGKPINQHVMQTLFVIAYYYSDIFFYKKVALILKFSENYKASIRITLIHCTLKSVA
jgi:hypothetical protein